MHERLKRSFLKHFSENEVEQIVRQYQLDKLCGSNHAVHLGLLQLVTDVRLYLPNFVVGALAGDSENLHIYHFDEVCW